MEAAFWEGHNIRSRIYDRAQARKNSNITLCAYILHKNTSQLGTEIDLAVILQHFNIKKSKDIAKKHWS
jgi:hypothetical protein